jgi:hypothetical protein
MTKQGITNIENVKDKTGITKSNITIYILDKDNFINIKPQVFQTIRHNNYIYVYYNGNK